VLSLHKELTVGKSTAGWALRLHNQSKFLTHVLVRRVPKPFKKILHHVITVSVFVNVITFLAVAVTNRNFETVLGVL
jgi:hypothetical protein